MAKICPELAGIVEKVEAEPVTKSNELASQETEPLYCFGKYPLLRACSYTLYAPNMMLLTLLEGVVVLKVLVAPVF